MRSKCLDVPYLQLGLPPSQGLLADGEQTPSDLWDGGNRHESGVRSWVSHSLQEALATSRLLASLRLEAGVSAGWSCRLMMRPPPEPPVKVDCRWEQRGPPATPTTQAAFTGPQCWASGESLGNSAQERERRTDASTAQSSGLETSPGSVGLTRPWTTSQWAVKPGMCYLHVTTLAPQAKEVKVTVTGWRHSNVTEGDQPRRLVSPKSSGLALLRTGL